MGRQSLIVLLSVHLFDEGIVGSSLERCDGFLCVGGIGPLLSLDPVLLHDFVSVEWHILEGVDSDEDGSCGGVDNVRVIAQAQGVEDGRFMEVRETNEIIDSTNNSFVFPRVLRGRTGDRRGLGRMTAAIELIGSGQVAQFDIVMVGRFELFRIDRDDSFEGLVFVVAVGVVGGSPGGLGGRVAVGGFKHWVVGEGEVDDWDLAYLAVFFLGDAGWNPAPP